ncbi:hypothetical protein M0654_19900 [Rhizobium sp. NTR19]|uniref:Uncharacterized protein n=1 Tax=Neorhizobium turbinariae TaxID=2937795 RepID=A0ABT0IWI5_9HYPH|nr:hypothetical protein [Neorhizobium turbinariae]
MLAQHLTVVINKPVADADYLRQARGLFNELQRALQTHGAVALSGANLPVDPIAPVALASGDYAMMQQRA